MTAIAAPSFAAFLKPADEIGPPSSILLYGPPGTRKTSMVAELIKRPNVNRILFVDIDNGTEALVGDPEVTAALKDGRIQVIPINSLFEGASLNEGAHGQMTAVVSEVANNYFGYDYVVIDTLNLAQDVAVKAFQKVILNKYGQPDTLGAWGEVSKWTDKIARLLHNSPHTTGIFILHEKNDAEEGQAAKIKPKLSGSAKDTIASIPSIVIHVDFAEIGEGDSKHTGIRAHLGESGTFTAKNRYRLPAVIDDFTMVGLMERIDEVLGLPAPTTQPDSQTATPAIAAA